MLLTSSLVAVALTGAVYSSLYQTYDITNNNKRYTKIQQRPGLTLHWPYTHAELNGNPRPEKSKRVKKRNPINLYKMIKCATSCSPWGLLDYGNYCGLGGSGRAINSIDRCCQAHDNCYGAILQKHYCSWRFKVYLLPYKWTCKNGEAYCQHGSSTCRREMCYCDKELTECLKRFGCP